MSQDCFDSTSLFYDSRNFPHGFSRSGKFTRHESELLVRCGRTIQALTTRLMPPMTPEHESMLRVIEGKQPPASDLEKVWIKYLRVVQQKQPFLRCALRPVSGMHVRPSQEYRELAFD